ncbi:hypothetical protein ETH_00033185, partial [Eimeria tenella]
GSSGTMSLLRGWRCGARGRSQPLGLTAQCSTASKQQSSWQKKQPSDSTRSSSSSSS